MDQLEHDILNKIRGYSDSCTISVQQITRKRFSEKPIVAFTSSTVFMLNFYMTKPVWSHVLALSALPNHI